MYRSAYNIIFHLYIIENNVMPFNLRYFDESFLAVDLYTFYCMRKKRRRKKLLYRAIQQKYGQFSCSIM